MKTLFALLVTVFILGAQEPVPRPVDMSRFHAAFYARMEPDSAAADLNGWSTSQRREGEKIVVRVGAYSRRRRIYWGCELLLEPREPDVYIARFRPLTVTAPDFISSFAGSNLGDPATWAIEPPPAWLVPQRITVGGTLTFTLMTNLLTGERLNGYLSLQPQVSASAFSGEVTKLSDSELRDLDSRLNEERSDIRKQINEQYLLAARPNPAVTASRSTLPPGDGPPLQFSAGDASMRLSTPLVRVNGVDQKLDTTKPSQGQIIWIYLPGSGRFLLSLLPRKGFAQTGAVEGRLIEVQNGIDSIVIESTKPIVSQFGNYAIYVKHEREWRPLGADFAQLGALGGKDSSTNYP